MGLLSSSSVVDAQPGSWRSTRSSRSLSAPSAHAAFTTLLSSSSVVDAQPGSEVGQPVAVIVPAVGALAGRALVHRRLGAIGAPGIAAVDQPVAVIVPAVGAHGEGLDAVAALDYAGIDAVAAIYYGARDSGRQQHCDSNGDHRPESPDSFQHPSFRHQPAVAYELAHVSAQDLQIAVGCGKSTAIAEAVPDFAGLTKRSLGAGGVLGGEMKCAELVTGTGNLGRVVELPCGSKRDVQRSHQIRPAHQQGKHAGKRAGQPQRFAPAAFTIEPLHKTQQRIDLAAQLPRVEHLALCQRPEQP